MSYEIVGKFINSYICDDDKIMCLIIIKKKSSYVVSKEVLNWKGPKLMCLWKGQYWFFSYVHKNKITMIM
jgi:hypothetical protein